MKLKYQKTFSGLAKTLSRRKFLGAQASVTWLALLQGCRNAAWPLAKEPVESRVGEKDPALGIPSPAVAQPTDQFSSLRMNASADYMGSLQKFGGKLSLPYNQLGLQYDIVIVGSGYGASIMAARLAARVKPGVRICVLERGCEWIPGTFPDTFKNYVEQVTSLNPLGLYDISSGDVGILKASGLGGSSLINANVAAIPDAIAFRSAAWPSQLQDIEALRPYYVRAAESLGVCPTAVNSSGKSSAMNFLASKLSRVGAHRQADLTVTTHPQGYGPPIVNPQGMLKRACTFCGDCMTGCNVGAKSTLATNYLPLAKKAGAEIFTETSVVNIYQEGSGYVVSCGQTVNTKTGWWSIFSKASKQNTNKQIRARMVILGAGSLGTTGILLRSQKSMPLSQLLGERFSANGDFFGLSTRIPPNVLGFETNIGGKGAYDTLPGGAGPTIQSMIQSTPSPVLNENYTIEDLAVPRAFVPSFEVGTGSSPKNAMFFLGMGHDSGTGRIVLNSRGEPQVSWPNVDQEPVFQKLLNWMNEAQYHLRATAPLWEDLLAKNKKITAHPLGGCVMGNDPSRGVVNHLGQVFHPSGQTYKGFYISDASVIPSSLGINPFLTISALAERAAENILQDPQYADMFHA